MGNKFQYKPRPVEAWDKRANQSGGTYIGFIKDDIEMYSASSRPDGHIRPLPPTWENAKHFGIEIWVHYGFGPLNASVLCPAKMDMKLCPGCEERQRRKDANREDEEDYKPTKRVLMYLLDRKAEKEPDKPLACALAWTADRDLAIACKDPESGQIYPVDNPYEGYDVFYKFTSDNKYVGWNISRRPSEVPESALEYIGKKPLPGVLIKRTYDELKFLLEGKPASQEDKPIEPVVDPAHPAVDPSKAPTEKADPAPKVEACTKEVIFKGVHYSECKLAAGHDGDCDHKKETPVKAEPAKTGAAATTGEAVPQIGGRASALRAKFNPPSS